MITKEELLDKFVDVERSLNTLWSMLEQAKEERQSGEFSAVLAEVANDVFCLDGSLCSCWQKVRRAKAGAAA